MHKVAHPTADLVIEDYTINDQRGKTVVEGRIVNSSVALHDILGAHEYMAQQLQTKRVGLIMMEAFPVFRGPLRCQPHLEYVHTAVSRAYAVPVVSFMRGVCSD
eukprot:1093382-Prymnesium_polylepis.1